MKIPSQNAPRLSLNYLAPQEVLDYLNARKGDRKLQYFPGDYQKFRDSKSSACWGNKLETENYHVAVCQPSRQSKDDDLFMFFDFKKKVK